MVFECLDSESVSSSDAVRLKGLFQNLLKPVDSIALILVRPRDSYLVLLHQKFKNFLKILCYDSLNS